MVNNNVVATKRNVGRDEEVTAATTTRKYGMSDADVLWRMELIRTLENQQKELADQIESLKDEVKAEMTLRDVDELPIGILRAVWKVQEPRIFDTQAFKADYADLYEQYRRPSPRRPFSVK